MKKIIWIVIIIIVFMLILLGIISSRKGSVTGQSGIVKIGFVAPLTGPVAGSSGETITNGWKLAVERRPIVAGKKVEVIYEDDACTPPKAASAAQKLLTVDKVDILVNGVCSGSALAMAPLAEQAKIILFTPVSTTPKLTTAGDYVFRTSGTGETIAKAILDQITKRGYKKIAIFYENQEYPVGIRDSVIKNLNQSLGQAIVAEDSITSKDTDFRSQLTKINLKKPEALVVVMNSSVTANIFVRQAGELGMSKLPIFANEYFAFGDVVKNPEAEGMYATIYKYDYTDPKFITLMSDYEKTFKKTPGQELYVALPFDGYNVIADAIERCGGASSDCVRDELYKVKNYQGISGVISIDQNGDTARESVIKQIKDGKLIEIE